MYHVFYCFTFSVTEIRSYFITSYVFLKKTFKQINALLMKMYSIRVPFISYEYS